LAPKEERKRGIVWSWCGERKTDFTLLYVLSESSYTLNIARIRPNTIFWIFGKGFFLIASVGLLIEHMTKEFERNFKKIRIFKRVAYLVFIVLCNSHSRSISISTTAVDQNHERPQQTHQL
jgi:hypothetical protein